MHFPRVAPGSRGVQGNVKVTVLICVALVAAGAAALALIFLTEPGAQRETAVRETAMLVDVTRAEHGTFQPVIEAMGAVMPEREITLSPRVGGQIVEIAEEFTPGGYVEQGEVLARIDEADYRNTLEQRQSELQQALSELEMQQGQAAKARQDYEDLDRELSPERKALVLRQPQIRTAEAQVRSAQAAVEQARLDLERTTIKAPFDAHVLTRDVNLGSQVNAGDPLGRLVGLDTYWVEATVPVDKLRWLSFADGNPSRASPARVRNRTAWPEDVFREGYLYKLIGELTGNTRMARVLVAVEDPLARETDAPPLMIGAFVETRIRGREISDVVRLDRDHMRQDDTVWLMKDGRLAISPVDVVFRDNEYAYIRDGLTATDRVVTTSLATVKDGVSLRTSETADSTPDSVTGSRR